MDHYFADFHIHIGRTKLKKAVKITGARSLTIDAIIEEAAYVKGLDIIGIIDCHVPEIIKEIEQSIHRFAAVELPEGGIRFFDRITLFLGSEIEINDSHCKGPIHVLVFLPDLLKMKHFSEWLSDRMTNVSLSSQRVYGSGKTLQNLVKEWGGLFIPAHVFTPFKSLYGKGVSTSLEEVFDPDLIDAIELGLSSDTAMADQIRELHRYPYLSNSDAHSLSKIAREYQKLTMKYPTFREFKLALQEKNGRQISANYGLNPMLGRYYRTICRTCFFVRDSSQPECPNCGHQQWIKGVYERIQELKNAATAKERPPYIHQVPLEYIPGIGPKSMHRLRKAFQTEMNILHHVTYEALKEVIPEKTARMIIQAREGKLFIQAGGGGKYGKVSQVV